MASGGDGVFSSAVPTDLTGFFKLGSAVLCAIISVRFEWINCGSGNE